MLLEEQANKVIVKDNHDQMFYNISDLKQISFNMIDARESFLVVYECGKNIPFVINRLFVVKSMQKSIRGSHAHKQCAQILIALNGECKVTCDDGTQQKEVVLNQSYEGILIPPSIWAKQEYEAGAMLMVLTNTHFDENDYIRDYNDFLKFRGASHT